VKYISHLNSFALVSVLIILLTFVRITYDDQQKSQEVMQLWSSDTHLTLERILSGPLPGLAADFRVLDVFSIFYGANNKGYESDYQYIYPYLKRAQSLDPKFQDVYRLAGSLLVYDANMPQEAVDLLRMGSEALTDNWEIPFFAGFIAHQQLNNDKLAFELMRKVTNRPNVPPLAINLAARFLNNTHTINDAIQFLKGLLLTMPKAYQASIQKKITELEAEIKEEQP